MPKRSKWIVTATGDLDTIKKQLTDAGFVIDRALHEIGVITGSAGEDVVKKVRSITGVADVSPDTDVDIGPPDAPTTW